MPLTSTRPDQPGLVATHATAAPAKPADRRNWREGWRWLTMALALTAVGLFAWSFFKPWWQFVLFAPQYPHKLHLEISLTGLGGDAHEINMLNHYIGMRGLDEAALVERKVAGYAVGFLGLLVVALALLVGKKYNPVLAVTGLLFPLGFLGDSFFWLYLFGHTMDPHAPLNIKAFTPSLFGGGTIGQFYTWAGPLVGFWLAVAAVGVLVLAVLARRHVCRNCPLMHNCSAVCHRGLVGPKPHDHSADKREATVP